MGAEPICTVTGPGVLEVLRGTGGEGGGHGLAKSMQAMSCPLHGSPGPPRGPSDMKHLARREEEST